MTFVAALSFSRSIEPGVYDLRIVERKPFVRRQLVVALATTRIPVGFLKLSYVDGFVLVLFAVSTR